MIQLERGAMGCNHLFTVVRIFSGAARLVGTTEVSRPILLVVEPHGTGHRAVWVRWIVGQMLGRGWRVIVATHRDTLQQPSFSWLAEQSGDVDVVTVTTTMHDQPHGSRASSLWRGIQRYRRIRQLYRRARREHAVDVVLLPFGDYILYATALIGSPFGRMPWVTVVMQPTFHHQAQGVGTPQPSLPALRRACFRRFLRTPSLVGCLTIDEPLFDYMRADPSLAAKAEYLPDPVAPPVLRDRSEARAALGISANAVVILVFGSLTERKGLCYLMSALRAFGRTEVQALVVGTADEAVRRLLQGADARGLIDDKRLHLVDRWIDDETEGAAFAAADIAWLGYCGHWQSSGVLVQAALSGLPLLACDQGLIGWLTQRHQCGLVIPVRQEAAVLDALDRLVSSPDLRRRMGERGRAAFVPHTAENAGIVLSKALNRALSSEGCGGRSEHLPLQG